MARWTSYNEDRVWRSYVADALRLVPQMMYPSLRYADVMGWTHMEPDRSAEEIVDDVLSRMGAEDGPT